MKQLRHFLVLVAALVLVATSCQKAPKEIPVSSVSLNKTSQELVVGESVQLNATVNPSDATEKTITWSSSNQAVATVAGGKVTAISEGTTSITASAGGKSATCSITVKKKTVGVMSIELNKTELTLTEGESETLVATVKPEDATDKTVTWSTSNAEVATVDNGKVVAVKEGESVISAKAGDKTATCKVVVDKKVITVSSVELNKNTLELVEGDSETLVATVKPDDATDKAVTWVTSDESIAAVEDDGKVTANKEGEATITAKAGDKSATCKVIVAKRIIPVTEVTLDHETLDLVEGDEVTLTATVKPDDATDKTVTWSTSDASIATIDEEGKITALAEGTATISASAGEMSMTCLVTVYKKVGQFLTFRSDGTTTVSMYNLSSNAPVLYYSYDRIHWTKWDYSELSFTNSAPLYLYGDNPEGISSREDKYSSFKAHGDSFGVSGSIMSLIDNNTDLKSIPSDFCFFSLFEECTLLTTAPELPATSLTKCCYKNMFYKCYSLASAPELPATGESVLSWYVLRM